MTDFGRDVYCLDSLQSGRYASGLRLLGQRCYHRLITPRGALRGGKHERNFGIDLAGMVGSTVSAQQQAALPGRIKNELLKEAEVQSVRATVVPTTLSDGTISWEITIDVQSALGPFDLVLAVSGVSVQLLSLGGV